MSWWMLALPGLILGAGVAVLIGTLAPKRVNVADALERLGTTTPPATDGKNTAAKVVGTWVERRLPDAPGFKIPDEDLALVKLDKTTFLYRKAIGASIGFLFMLILGLLTQLLVPFPLWVWLIAAVIIGVIGWFNVDFEVRARARRYRAEFTEAMASYLGLVAGEVSDGTTGPARAMTNAAKLADSRPFIRIRQELALAEYSGDSQWDALAGLAEQIKVPALEEVARIMRLAGEGARVTDSLRGANDALRNAIVTQAHAEANAQSVKMGPPMALTIFVLSGLLITPALMSIFTVG